LEWILELQNVKDGPDATSSQKGPVRDFREYVDARLCFMKVGDFLMSEKPKLLKEDIIPLWIFFFIFKYTLRKSWSQSDKISETGLHFSRTPKQTQNYI
jgi:hypothetical protein